MKTVVAAHVVLFPVFLGKVLSLDCFKCYSFNNTDPHCGDPFHPAYGNYVKDCTAGKEGRIGEFPAKHCIKLIGTTAVDGIEMVFRGCSLESLDSQCGDFKFEDVRYKGCVTSCEEKGCNTANSLFNCHIYSHLTVVILFNYISRMVLIGEIL